MTPYPSVNSAILPHERNHTNSRKVCSFSIIDFLNKYYCLPPRGIWGIAFILSFCMATFPSLLEFQYTPGFEGICGVRTWGSTIRRQAHERKIFLSHLSLCPGTHSSSDHNMLKHTFPKLLFCLISVRLLTSHF